MHDKIKMQHLLVWEKTAVGIAQIFQKSGNTIPFFSDVRPAIHKNFSSYLHKNKVFLTYSVCWLSLIRFHFSVSGLCTIKIKMATFIKRKFMYEYTEC